MKQPTWSEQIAVQYDSWYAADGYQPGKSGPVEAVEQVAESGRTGTVLDIGGGDGRHALFLARQGFVVTVVDLSAVGLEKITTVATAENLSIETICADIAEYTFTQQFDIVVCTFTLHHLSSGTARVVLERAKQATVVGGAHVIVGFGATGALYDRAKKSGRCYLDQSFLNEVYAGWDIQTLRQKETTTMARDKSGVALKNQMIELVAEKI